MCLALFLYHLKFFLSIFDLWQLFEKESWFPRFAIFRHFDSYKPDTCLFAFLIKK